MQNFYVQFGRKIAIPPTIQIKHEIMRMMLDPPPPPVLQPSRLGLALAMSLFAAGTAQAAPKMNAAIASPPIHDSAGEHDPIAAADLRYETGAFYYGGDCGGNSAMTAAAKRSNRPGGVILAGRAGREIARNLNCDDRRNALSSYGNAFQGKIGQAYAWRNPNGGASGSVTTVRRHQLDGLSCVDFQSAARSSQWTFASRGTACRRPDGNWHTL